MKLKYTYTLGKLLLSLVFFAVANISQAQQFPLFSNYLTNNYGFNPAFAGTVEGIEGKLVYRNQWTGLKLAPKTGLLNVHAKLKNFPIGVGGYIFTDTYGKLGRKGAVGTFSLHRQITMNTVVSLGAAIGMSRTTLDGDYFALDPNDPTLASATKGANTPEMNIGLLVRSGNAYFAVSTPQFLVQPLGFKTTNEASAKSELVRHYYGLFGYKKMLGKKYVEPSALLKYIPEAPLQWEASLKFGTGTPVWVAGSYRSNAAATVMVGFDLKNSLSLAYAYDLTTSGLSAASKSSHELTLGFHFMQPKDTDHDGIPDDKDKCPEQPGTIARQGCPPPTVTNTEKKRDRDKDGVPDDEDDCPELPGTKENNGCPANDRDKDGVPDDEDKCPDIFGYKQFEGCPMMDRDNDGLRDDLDHCPDEPGPVSNMGCPAGKGDADGDGVRDEDDECPNTLGTKTNHGCPEVSDHDKNILNLAIQNLYFDTDKWIIKPNSKPHLDKLAKVMSEKRDWKIRLAGHADARGSSDHNLTLSKNRAEAVMYYLMSKGVKREQLIVEYYGAKVPIADNKSVEGLSMNRRVEMEFIFN